jgi:hypothetical protein
MTLENATGTSYWYGPYEGYEARCQRRLQDALGVDETAAEAIVRLRSQVLELQSRIRQMAAELAILQASQTMRLGRWRDACYEATWIELDVVGSE